MHTYTYTYAFPVTLQAIFHHIWGGVPDYFWNLRAKPGPGEKTPYSRRKIIDKICRFPVAHRTGLEQNM